MGWLVNVKTQLSGKTANLLHLAISMATVKPPPAIGVICVVCPLLTTPLGTNPRGCGEQLGASSSHPGSGPGAQIFLSTFTEIPLSLCQCRLE